jgi:DNA repair protein SbcD/Mre11
MAREIRILLVADSHLGFDLPVRPRVERRRRGHDFVANYLAALEPAFSGEVDVVVHGGDVFDRPETISTVAYQAFEPLRRIADRGVPVFIVPGNHERSRLPHLRFAHHPRLHVFDQPRTFTVKIRGTRLAIAGFPYQRKDVRTRFGSLLEATGWRRETAELFLLALHHCVEGATVGPGDFTFTTGSDVIRPRDVPPRFSAVLSGHIHRHQVLTTDLAARPLSVPVLYPGSIERTSAAEIGEPKGFLVIRARVGPGAVGLQWEFRPLAARPMIRKDVSVDGASGEALESTLRAIVGEVPRDAVLSIRITGPMEEPHWRVVSAAHLRTFVPATMNVDVVPAQRAELGNGRSPNRRPAPSPQLSLGDLLVSAGLPAAADCDGSMRPEGLEPPTLRSEVR